MNYQLWLLSLQKSAFTSENLLLYLLFTISITIVDDEPSEPLL